MMKKGAITLILAFLLMPVYAMADFSGVYDPSSWTTTLGGDPPGGGGTVDTSGAPASITLNGGNSGCWSEIGTCVMDFTITAPASGPVSFDWLYDSEDPFFMSGPRYDLFLILNGAVVTQLSDDNGPEIQSGSEIFNVVAGDTFGFRIDPTDANRGPAIVTISNFNGPLPAATAIPTMNEWGMIILFVLIAGTAFRSLRRRTLGA